jgi:integrase
LPSTAWTACTTSAPRGTKDGDRRRRRAGGGQDPGGDALTVSGAIDRHLEAISGSLKPGTLALYRNIAKWVNANIGAVPLVKLTPGVVNQQLRAKLLASGSLLGRGALSPCSVDKAIVLTKAATRAAWEAGLVRRDPLAGYRRPKFTETDRVSSALSLEEAGQVLSAAAEDRWRLAGWLFLTRGMRRGEICGLRWANVDLETGRLRIVHTRVVVANRVVSSEPKTKAGRRPVPLDAGLVAEFRAHVKRQKEERLHASEAWEESGYVFTDELGRPCRP